MQGILGLCLNDSAAQTILIKANKSFKKNVWVPNVLEALRCIKSVVVRYLNGLIWETQSRQKCTI